MDVRVIAISMVVILAALFLFARRYVPRERAQSRLEGDYFAALRTYRKKPSDEGKKRTIDLAYRLGAARGLDDSAIKQMLAHDLGK